ncbi:hypothetical protein pb186bvf_019843 [Paramecium bursaria]
MKLSLSTEWLFFHLWKKNPDTNQSCPGVFVADTIIYRWAQPYFWYFTSKDGQILRKTKERIFVEQIEEIFLRNGEITALYLQSQSNKIIFEYFQKNEFPLFLHQREKALNALLQKFIEPKNSKNSMIKVSWSPQFCLLSRKTNINDLKNAKINIEERLSTFEGPEHLSIADSIASPILSADIEQICLNIVKHIQDVSGGNIQISRMVLFFKIDEKNRLWLLFSSGVKVRQKFINEETLADMPKNRDRIMSPIMILQSQPKRVQFPKFSVDTQGMVSSNSMICNNCSSQGDLYELQLSQYIEAYDQGVLDEESKLIRQKMLKQPVQKSEIEDDYYVESSINIPGIILKMWGKMDPEKYNNLKLNPSFMQIKVKFCLECYLMFTKIQVESKTDRDVKTQQVSRQTNWVQSKPQIESASLLSQKPTKTPIKIDNKDVSQKSSIQTKVTIPKVPKLVLPPAPSKTQTPAITERQQFPSQRAPFIYKNKQGVSIQSQQHSFNSTRSTITHSMRMQSIQQLKELLQDQQL